MTEQAMQAAEAAAHGKPVGYQEAGLGEDFAKLVRRRAEIAAAQSKLDALMKDNTEKVRGALEASGIRSVTVDQHWQPTICAGRQGAKKIDGFKLMQLNSSVTADQIVKATVQGEPGKPYLLVTDLTRPRGQASE